METVIYPFDLNIFLKLAKFELLALFMAIFCLFFKEVTKTSVKILIYGAFAWLFMISWVQLNSTEFLVNDSFSFHPIQTAVRFLTMVFTLFVLRFTSINFTSKQYSLIFFILCFFSLSQSLLLQVANPIITGVFISISYYFYKKKLTPFSACIPKISFTLILFSLYGLLDMHHPLSRVAYSSSLFFGYFALGAGVMYWDRLETHKFRFFYFFYVGFFLIHLLSSSVAFLMVYRDMSLGVTLLMGVQFFMIWFLLMFAFSQYINKTNAPNFSSLLFLSLSYLGVIYSIPTKESFIYLAYNSAFLIALLAYYISDEQSYKLKELTTLTMGSLVLAVSGYFVLPNVYHERLYPLLFMLVLAFIVAIVAIYKQKQFSLFKSPMLLCCLLVLIPVNEIKEIAGTSYTRFMDVRDELAHLLKISNSQESIK